MLPTGFFLNTHAKNNPPRNVSMFMVTMIYLNIFYNCFASAMGDPYFSWDKEELMFLWVTVSRREYNIKYNLKKKI